MRKPRVHLLTPFALGAGSLMALTACGSSTPTGASASGTSASTVSMRTIGGQQVLVDHAGDALYSNDQDTSAQPRCTSSDCTAIWAPLTVPKGSTPTAASGVTGTVGIVQRPDGGQQVALNGRPLYTFTFDHGPGKVTGNGTHDSFAGTSFTWHSALSAAGTPAPTQSTPGGGNGYNY